MILKLFLLRDLDATVLHNGYYTPVFGPSNGTGLLRIKAYLNYVEAVVEYAPGFWNTLKWAWIQYASIFVVFFYVVDRIKDIVFTHQMIPTWNDKQINKPMCQ